MACLVPSFYKKRNRGPEREVDPHQNHSDGLGVQEAEVGPEPRAPGSHPYLKAGRRADAHLLWCRVASQHRTQGLSGPSSHLSPLPPPFLLPGPVLTILGIDPIPHWVYLKSSLSGSFRR